MRKEDSIQTIKGIGEKTAESFARLGIFTIDDLLHTYPRNYLSYEKPVCIRDAAVGERHAIRAMITSYVTVKQVRSLKLTILTVSDGDMTMHMTWFNQPFLRNVFHKGDSYIFVGTVKVKNGMRVMEQAEYYKLPVYAGMQQEMQPVYPLTSGLSNKTFQKAIMATRELICQMDDYVPEEVRAEHSLMELSEAYENIHFPMNQAVLKNAIRRLAFDEFYQFLYDMASMKKTTQLQENLHKIVQGKAVADYISNLPFSLTKGQQQAIEDILADMGGDGVMNRLIQGDVGSGKTVVAAAALLACAKAGYQGALMAPTEVLARQHYEELAEQFAQYDIRTACLVGSTPLKEKRRIYEAIQQGEVDIVIGTHALLEDKVEFKDLALVVTDEQHRFGVNQRKKLSDKGYGVHTLVMSATPIPRTLAIILYADMDISIIKELPKGRKPIKNCVVGTNYRQTAYQFIAGQIAEQSQVYVVCPMVEEYLYSAMEDYRIDIMIDKGPSARSIQLDLNPFTLVGATTRSGLLTAPLRARFGINLHLEYYDDDVLTAIIRRSAKILNVPCDVQAAGEIASRSRGTPRIANALLRRVRDFAQVKGSGRIDVEIARFALEALNIDRYGLDEIDNKILCTIIDKFKGGPVGLTTIATALGEDPGTIEEVYEPFLIKEGFLKRTPRGREVTELAYIHLGRSIYNSQKTLFDD